MTKGQDYYRQNIFDDAWVDIYTATNTAMFTYPRVLGNPDECSPTLADMAETYIMDSKIMDESVTNEDVIRRGKHVGADVVTPADVLHDPETTTERIIDLFVQLADVDDFTPDVLVPLQPRPEADWNHVDHYHQVCATLEDHGLDITDYRLSVGGVKQWSSRDQLQALLEVREVAGSEQYIHGLGFGATRDWIAVLRQYPDLVDSVDMSSVVQDIVNSNVLLNPEMERVEYPLPRGKNSTVLSVMLREFVLYMMNYFLGPHVRESDVPTEVQNHEKRTLLSQYGVGHTDGDTQSQTASAD